jgi:hypothetical protein
MGCDLRQHLPVGIALRCGDRAVKISSAKAKGRALQQKVAAKLLAAFPSLQADDIKSTPMSSSGEDVQLSPAARKVLGVQIECKKHAKHAVYTFYDQCAKTGKHQPLVVIEADRRKPLAVVDLDYFVSLLLFSVDEREDTA